MEIKNCEEYVLSQLADAQDKIAELESEMDTLRDICAEYARALHMCGAYARAIVENVENCERDWSEKCKKESN